MRTPTSVSKASLQRGASLFVVLILLLVMTLLGLSILRSTLMEERMSANLYDRSLSFQSAETALREAEGMIQQAELAGNRFGFDCSVVGMTCPSIPTNALTGAACAGGKYCWTTMAAGNQVLSDGMVPQYYVEYMGKYTSEDDYNLGGSANANQYGSNEGTPLRHFYRISARSHNPVGSDRSVVVLQSNVIVK